MEINNVMVAGSGVLGSQIAFQTAFYGYQVNIYDINDDVLVKAKERINALIKTYTDYFKDEQKAKEAVTRITFHSDIEKSVENIDLVIEAIPEVIDIKKDFYKELGKVSPEKTIFATNTSTLLPSQFAQDTGRPEKFSDLHFANDIREKNTAEVMGHEGTSEGVINLLLDFAESIGMVPLHVKKEHPGYLLNSLLVPFLTAGQGLWANGIADPETIDKTWMIATGAPLGPFAIRDNKVKAGIFYASIPNIFASKIINIIIGATNRIKNNQNFAIAGFLKSASSKASFVFHPQPTKRTTINPPIGKK